MSKTKIQLHHMKRARKSSTSSDDSSRSSPVKKKKGVEVKENKSPTRADKHKPPTDLDTGEDCPTRSSRSTSPVKKVVDEKSKDNEKSKTKRSPTKEPITDEEKPSSSKTKLKDTAKEKVKKKGGKVTFENEESSEDLTSDDETSLNPPKRKTEVKDFPILPEDSPLFTKVPDGSSSKYDAIFLAYWDSCMKPNDDEVSFTISEDRSGPNLNGEHLVNTNVTYEGTRLKELDKQYHIPIDEDGDLVHKKVWIFRMKPTVLSEKDKVTTSHAMMSREDRFTELNTKFGSKKQARALNQRKIITKLDYEGNMVDDLELHNTSGQGGADDNDGNNSDKDEQSSLLIKSTLDVVPPRKDDATNPRNVYKIDDIVPKDHQEKVKNLIKCPKWTPKNIDFPYFRKKFDENPGDETIKILCVYGDFLYALLTLERAEFNKPTPIFSAADKGIISSTILETYAVKEIRDSKKSKWVISKKDRDIITARLLIIILHMEKFSPINLELMSTTLKMPRPKVKAIAEALGFHVPKATKAQTVSMVFKTPIFIPKVKGRGKGRPKMT